MRVNIFTMVGELLKVGPLSVISYGSRLTPKPSRSSNPNGWNAVDANTQVDAYEIPFQYPTSQ